MAAAVLLAPSLFLGWLLAAMLPLLAWSRVALARHSWSEVAIGLAIGAATGVAIGRFG
jgi:membrane-associated phospholipid phosphatase